MAEESAPVEAWNYFNYFTEVEEHFQRARGTGMFLMSPLDWALVENWKNSGIPLEAVLRGIEHAFEKWHAKKTKHRLVNSVAYCTQAVIEEARALAKGTTSRASATAPPPPFSKDEVESYLRSNAVRLRDRGGFDTIADSLEDLANEIEDHFRDLEELEQRLTAMEDKMAARVIAEVSEEELFQVRRELEGTLRPYRSKMTAEQIARLEQQYISQQVQQRAGLPRLSLFYLT
ncbi:MAG TPA: hypothetical protein VES20_20610 [Bryobacteraceae bacterium]|nr:hypothetical protein [Bryobacteraceae bacterium]